VFCNQRKITGNETEPELQKAESIIEEHLSTIGEDDCSCEIAFFGGSFTGIPMEEQIRYLELAKKWIEKGKVDGIRLSTRPDYINEEILSVLKSYGVKTIELGAQSMDDGVLIAANRGHSLESVEKASELIKAYGFNLGLQMMIGLPGDTLEKSIMTAEAFIGLKPDCVRIYPTLVIKDTELENSYLNGDYKPLELDEAVLWTSRLLKLFKQSEINVIRVGLQPTEMLQNGEALVAGPFHPAFRQLAESRMFFEGIDAVLSNCIAEGQPVEPLTITTHNRCVSMASGVNKSNRKALYKKYGIKDVSFVGDNELASDEVLIKTEKQEVLINIIM